MAAPKLNPAFTLRVYISKDTALNLNTVKSGPSRIISPLTHGFLEGPGLKADILPGGSDWILHNPTTNTIHIDVRTQARTPDGHGFYIHYDGILKLDEAGEKVLGWKEGAQPTQFGDTEWFNSPILETSHPEYKWVEEAWFLGQGRWVVDEEGRAVEYRVFLGGELGLHLVVYWGMGMGDLDLAG
ncbi:hypothetical protein ASPWEDRAFT_187618 [Aspergillus wentii DTO 134E9]|uniref:Uncharacterized protein n=1 Tax=Aspergillus wentii DTO 134E9 TaxID=1073089 RepID=A0A1L9R5K4_ASPWE|nr:uncharacterized protein ASPWEDRAFT_187618 [Aspergillus wentii DTO 134E9]KAI9925318.1 hypothetical protein MW887_006246 [Aspergillus wentii]OJJ30184.1 hypothetical protein ASPWEDRAFT_187618 [Aspergillus wentii DTO 134E9]